MPGVVYAIACAIRAFTGPGDAVIIQQPVYYPFYETIVDNHRKCINSQLIYEDGRYRMDYEDFEQKIIENQADCFCCAIRIIRSEGYGRERNCRESEKSVSGIMSLSSRMRYTVILHIRDITIRLLQVYRKNLHDIPWLEPLQARPLILQDFRQRIS